MEKCIVCGKQLKSLDVACYLKFVDRGATQYQCRECLSNDFGWSLQYMDSLVQMYRARGCTLFPLFPTDEIELKK